MLGRDQHHGKPSLLQFTSPVVGTAAGFHGDGGIRVLHQEFHQLVASELAIKGLFTCLVNAAYLKNSLCQIDSN